MFKNIFLVRKTKHQNDVAKRMIIVAKEHSQLKRINHDKNFSMVVRYNSITVMLSLISSLNMDLEQMSVKITFLHVNLDEQTYM